MLELVFQFLHGENGILNKAQIAKEESDKSSAEEESKLSKTNEIMNNYTTRSGTTTLSEDEYNNLINRINNLENKTVAPSGTIENLTFNSTNGSKYTAPEDGYYKIAFYSTNGTNGYLTMNSSNGLSTGGLASTNLNLATNIFLPMKKGDVMQTWFQYISVLTFEFIYM